MDFSDVYIETLTDDDDGVVFRGEDVAFTRRTFQLEYSDGTSEERELLFVPHHGAVREIDTELGTAITLRWTGNDLDTDINCSDRPRASVDHSRRRGPRS